MKEYRIRHVIANNFKGIIRKPVLSIKDLILLDLKKDGLALLSGPNGYGKTTVFDIVEIIMSKSITRFNSTKYGNESFKDNGLLNNTNYEGIIGIILENKLDQKDQITLLGIIKNDQSNGEIIDVAKTISLFYKYGNLNEEDISNIGSNSLIDFIKIDDICSIDEFNNFNPNVFNLFYYISQEESTHFLKQKVNDKISTLDSLVNIDDVVNKKDWLRKMTSGSNSYKISYRIKELEDIILDKLKLNKEGKGEVVAAEYQRIFNSEMNVIWDSDDVDISNSEMKSDYIKSIDGLHSLFSSKDEFMRLYDLNRVEYFFKNSSTIEVFLVIRKCELIDDKNLVLNKITMNEIIDSYSRTHKILEVSDILGKKNIEEELKYSDVENCYNILKITDLPDKEKFDSLVMQINEKKTKLGENEKLLSEMTDIRTEFIKSYVTIVENTEVIFPITKLECPLCGTPFNKGRQDLLDKIEATTKRLEISCLKEKEDIKEPRKQFINMFKLLNIALDALTDKEKNLVVDENTFKVLSDLLKDEVSQKNVNSFIKFESKFDFGETNIAVYENSELLKEALKASIGSLSNQFVDLNSEHKFLQLFKTYFDNNRKEYKYLLEDLEATLEKLINKKKYLEYLDARNKRDENDKRNKEIRETAKQMIILKKVEKLLKNTHTLFDREIKRFRERTIEEIEMPLYLYTGKILQNYQRGLGVFIKNNGTRVKFVPHENTDHEIIHSFSSGQLSGFVIAFMLVMNKVYTGDNNILNSILIDDPVQTMDDINIASLVDVLRNEFSDKQVILSTHEDLKANYIMYKFAKHDIDFEYFSVKEIFCS